MKGASFGGAQLLISTQIPKTEISTPLSPLQRTTTILPNTLPPQPEQSDEEDPEVIECQTVDQVLNQLSHSARVPNPAPENPRVF